MPIQFPINPILNQEYSFNNKTWSWNGSAWIGILEDYIRLSVDARPDIISIGKKDSKTVQYDSKFIKWYLLSDQTGDITFDIQKSSINNYLNTTSIITSNYPNLINSNSSSENISTWNNIDKDDILDFIVTNNDNIKNIELVLVIRRIR
jgi:hypothetical protein